MKGQLTVGSLFSGIGGLDLGLERAGMRVVWQSEIEPYACRVLRKHWPDVPNIGDVTQVDWSVIEKPDVICGGYPCQPFSLAGRRKGENDERHLWPFVREAISHLRPRYAILENVRGHLSLGGLTVIGDLATIGYDAEWRIISAASVGANHRRDRIFIVAYPNNNGQTSTEKPTSIGTGSDSQPQRQISTRQPARCSSQRAYVADTTRDEGDGRQYASVFGSRAKDRLQGTFGRSGRPEWLANWQVEPDVGRVADGIPARVDRLAGLGNAVVPQVAEVVGRLVMSHAGLESPYLPV